MKEIIAMKKILFLIHDLGPGGAEKVLVNLVNNMDKTKFDITVHSLFDEGVNRQFLAPHIHYTYSFSKMFRGNSKIMKVFSPKLLHKLLIKEHFDVEVAYLEGPSTRIISGCLDKTTKLVAWIHTEFYTTKSAAASFRSVKETENCYNNFHQIVCVSKTVKQRFEKLFSVQNKLNVYYNTNESEKIIKLASKKITECEMKKNEIKLIGIGKLLPNKGFDRMLKIVYRLRKEGIPVSAYILGDGTKEKELKTYIKKNDMQDYVQLMGYQTNPYKFLARSDLFVCASYREGFSTAATEALILGVPVCTVEVSGMKEMLGENNEYGIVTENNDEALYEGIRCLVKSPELLRHYRKQAQKRGDMFSTEKTVAEVENMLLML